MKKILRRLVLCLVCSSPVLANAELRETVVTVEVRPGVTQRYLQVAPKKPAAVAILFAGYGGYLAIGDRRG